MTPEELKSDVIAKVESHDAPGKMKAINWGGMLNTVDTVIQKGKPVIETFTPAQYRFLVEALAAAIHDVNTHVHPS